MAPKSYMRVENVTKKFGPFTALNGVDLDVYPGEVHALLGDNGAGKSTLIKILSGVHQPTSGKIYMEEVKRSFRSPREASAAGIGTVYQDLAINQLMSVTRNFFMGRELTSRFGALRMDYMNQIAHDEMLKIGINFSDPTQAVGTMSGGQRQTLAIARAIYFGAKVLILDEPTSGLDPFHQRSFFEIIEEFSDNGASILLSSHIISEVEKVAKSMAVLRDGAKVYDETYETFLNKAQEDGKDLEDAFFSFYDRKESNA